MRRAWRSCRFTVAGARTSPFLVACVLGLTLPAAVGAQITAPASPRLLHIPTAGTVPTGTVDWRYDGLRDASAFPGANKQRNLAFSLGFVPRITLTARGTTAKDSVTGLDIARDLSASAQVLVLEPRSWRPALAVGLQDVGGAASNFRSRYAVLTTELFGHLRATLGYGTGPDVLKGAFGGGELSFGRALTLIGEYDADAFNAGLRFLPFPARWDDRGIPRPTLDVLWQRGRSVSLGVGVRTYLGAADRSPPIAARRALQYRRADATALTGLPLQKTAERLQAELMLRGLENVRVTIEHVPGGMAVSVEYENRTYNRSELDAIGLVLGLAALRTPASVTEIRVVVKALNIPVLEVSASGTSYVAFLNGEESADAFAQQLYVSQRVRSVGISTPEAETGIGARSWLKLDLFVRPRVETTVLTEWGVFDARFTALPDAQMQLTRGTSVDVRAAVPMARTRNYPARLGDAAIDRALLQQAVPIPLGRSSAAALTQVSVGRFDAQHVGVSDEVAVSFGDGAFLAKGTVARVGPASADLDHWVALANARLRYPAWDFTLSMTAGQFLDGDRGYTIDAGRYFGNTETAVFFRHSERGSLAGIRFALPLTVTKELAPWRVRPRLPDVYSYEHRTTVLADRNEIRSDVGRLPSTDHEIERIYWDRDRLHGAYIRRHVESLRRAARNLIADGS